MQSTQSFIPNSAPQPPMSTLYNAHLSQLSLANVAPATTQPADDEDSSDDYIMVSLMFVKKRGRSQSASSPDIPAQCT